MSEIQTAQCDAMASSSRHACHTIVHHPPVFPITQPTTTTTIETAMTTMSDSTGSASTNKAKPAPPDTLPKFQPKRSVPLAGGN
jgi:hypothetical protein